MTETVSYTERSFIVLFDPSDELSETVTLPDDIVTGRNRIDLRSNVERLLNRYISDGLIDVNGTDFDDFLYVEIVTGSKPETVPDIYGTGKSISELFVE